MRKSSLNPKAANTDTILADVIAMGKQFSMRGIQEATLLEGI